MLKALNNEAEYKALIAVLELCYTAGVDSVRAFSGSPLVVSHLIREYEVKDHTMAAYVCRVQKATRLLKHFSILHIPLSEIGK